MLDDDAVTLGERFRDAGYRTAAFGTNPHISGRNLLQEVAEYQFGPHVSLPALSPAGRFMLTVFPKRFGPVDSTDDISDNAIGWLERNKSARFFLWVHYLDPHVPYSVARSDLEDYPDGVKIMNRSWRLPGLMRGGEVLPPAWIETIKALYGLETAAVDNNIGRLLDRMRDLGLYGETVILLTSDHGEELWDHGSYEHGHSLYDELLHVPLIFKVPAMAPGRVIPRVATTQVPRTLLDAAGLTTGDDYLPPPLPDAESGQTAQNATVLIGAPLYFDEQIGIIFDNFKYVRNSATGAESLFDLAADAEEKHPLTDAKMLNAARQRLAERWESAVKSRELFLEEAAAPPPIPVDLLRSLGYL
jgi:arylsulfatase A-like enzyme